MASSLPSTVKERTDGPTARQPSGKAVEQTSDFFRLSAELRNMIYKEVILLHDELWVCARRGYTLSGAKRAPIALSQPITQVCPSMREEALPMIFGKGIVSITLMSGNNVKQAKRWAAAVGDVALWARQAVDIARLRIPPYVYLRLCIEKQRDSGFTVFRDELAIAYPPDAEATARIEALGRSFSEDGKPVSCYKHFDMLLELFASRLEFRRGICG